MADEFTQDDLTALDAQLKSGISEVKFADREMKNNSVNDMLKVRSLIKQSLDDGSGAPTRRQLRVYTGSGW